MKTITVDEANRSFNSVLEQLERDCEEVSLVRAGKTVARLIPESPGQTATEIFGDISGALDAETADAIAKTVSSFRDSKSNRLSSLKNPWHS